MQRDPGIPGLRTCEYLIARMQRRHERPLHTTPVERSTFFVRVSQRLRSAGAIAVDDADRDALEDSLTLLSEERQELDGAPKRAVARTYRFIDAGIAFVTALRDRRPLGDDRELDT